VDDRGWQRLFVDKNANGDLTDDGPPIKPSNVRNIGSNHWDYNYFLDAITPTNGSRHTNFQLRRWNYGEDEDSYGLSLSVDGKIPMYAGWFGTFWSAQCETAPDHPLWRRLDSEIASIERIESIRNRFGATRLSLGFMNPDRVQARNRG
jgi:hypothetical protein